MNVIIEKIEVLSFGKLKNAVVTADSGINILSAPNESGKSTLASFIKFVFYGFVGGRMQNLTDNERKLYTPWDGEVCEGSVTVSADGEKYVISRRCAPSGKETCEIINRNTGKPEFTGAVPGEVFFGVSEEIFARTLFFRQLTVPQAKDEVLADRLRDIAISADEQVSTQKALKKLTDAKNELKGRAGNGLIPKAEKERDALEEEITASTDLRREVSRLNSEMAKRTALIEAGEEKLKMLNNERKNIEKYDALLRLRTINRLTLEENLAHEEYEKTSSGLKQQADGQAFSLLSAKNAELVAEQRNCKTLEESLEIAEDELYSVKSKIPFGSEESKKAKRLISSSQKVSKFLFIIAAVAAVAGLIVYFAVPAPAGFLAVALGGILGVVGAVMMGKPAAYAKELGLKDAKELKTALQNLPMLEQQLKEANNRAEELRDLCNQSRISCKKLKTELDDEIGKYAVVNDESSYSKQIENILSLSAVSGEKLAVWRAKKEEYRNVTDGVDIEALSAEARGATQPEREKALVDRDISFYTKQIAQLTELNRRDELDVTAYEAKSGDPAILVGKRDVLSRYIDELTVKHKAYETAIKLINDSGDYMKSMVAPRIGDRADEYFTAATGGKYTSFEVDTRMSMSFGEDFRRSCDYLSAGTRDSAYLSLRLALADMLFPDGVPVLLDDAFVRIDDGRLRMMSGALKEASKKHQLIILTHSAREADALDDAGIKYQPISIKTI